MDRRSFIAGSAIAAATSTVPTVARAAASRTYVLVHGAFLGGWCWSKVASILRGRGHTVLTPTLTGLGERSHLISKSIDLDLFATDLTNVIKYEDLHDIVLVGHSFGGVPVSAVADTMRDRIRRLVYLNSVILEKGQTVFDQLPKEVVAARTKAAQDSSGGLSVPPPPPSAIGISDPAQAQFVQWRLTPHPFSSFVSPLNLTNKVGNGLPAIYIVCTDPLYEPTGPSRAWAKAAGWRMAEIKSGHLAMVIAPDRLADMLDTDAV